MTVDLDPLSAAFLEDPYTNFRRLREEAPVAFIASRNMWIVTRYDDVVAAARTPAVFSSTGGVGYDWNQRPMMPMYDPPEHTRMRRMVAKHFTPSAVTAFKGRVEALVDDLVSRALEAGTIDFVADLALPLSLGTIAELLGVPPELRGQLRRWSVGTVEDLAGGLSPRAARRVDELRREFNVYLKSLIVERGSTLAERQGALDVITALVAAHDDEKLDDRELIAFFVLLLVAGYETTINAIANGMIALLDHPSELEALRRDRTLLAAACEEMVRYDSPVLSFFRNTLSDAPLGGQRIPKGSKVMLAFASGNRDHRQFEDPDVFRIARNPSDHLGYGAGVHYCLGAPLARLQLTTVFGALLDRVGHIEPAGEAVRTASVLFRGVRSFPLRIAASAKAGAATGKVSFVTTTTAGPNAVPSPVASSPILPTLGSGQATSPGLSPEPFRLAVAGETLDDLAHRLAHVRWPDEVEWAGWDYGTSRVYLRELVAYWRDRYDWRTHEAQINELPMFRARVADVDVHYVHVRSRSSKKLPLLLLHGWPGPFLLFRRLVAELASDDRDLVVGSLPGFPFSGATTKRGMGTIRMADVFASLMHGLGYERYGIVGEDLGTTVASRMGLVYSDAVAGVHLNMPLENPPRDQMSQLTTEETTWLREMGRIRDRDLTHLAVHTRQPQSLTYGLTDSPTGLAGWLVDKYRGWSDCGGDVERVFTKDELLTNVMTYWVSGSIGSALRIYHESRQLPFYLASGERIPVPTAIALTKHEIVRPPRRWIERAYNLQRLTHLPSGGHFGAWERPAAFAEDIRAFFDELAV